MPYALADPTKGTCHRCQMRRGMLKRQVLRCQRKRGESSVSLACQFFNALKNYTLKKELTKVLLFDIQAL